MISMFFCWYFLKEKNANLILDLCICFEREVLNSVKFSFMLGFIIREMELYTETALMCLLWTTSTVKFLIVTRRKTELLAFNYFQIKEHIVELSFIKSQYNDWRSLF